MLNDPSTGLAARPAEVEPYKAGLSLDAVSQPYISAGIDRFGGMVGGGIAFNLSDMLGNHNLYAQISADTYGGGAADIVEEHRRARRLYEHVEAVELGFRRRAVAVHRRRVCDRAGRRERRAGACSIRRSSSGRSTAASAAWWPIRSARPRASSSAAASRGRRSTSRSGRRAISRRTGRVLDDSTVTTPLADPLNMSSVSTALVTDSSLFGATSPVAGRRSRFEISPTFGDLQLTTALADYRHYFMPARFYTIAVRGMHYGRYGAGAEDSRLMPLLHRVSGVRARIRRRFVLGRASARRARRARPSIDSSAAGCWWATSNSGSRCCGRSA